MRFLIGLLCGYVFAAPLPALAGTLAQFRTPLGDIEVELFDVSKPVTVQNFIRYVQSDAYKDMFIHRWEPGFVIQGGGFAIAGRHTADAQIVPVSTFPAITNEYGVGRIFSNVYGTLAMARVSGETNSATSQWFFNLGSNTGLDRVDGGFTVFGRLLQGTNVLNRFNNLAVTNGIYWVNGEEPFTRLPVLALDASFDDLVYVDITLLNVRVTQQPGGLNEISWQSVSNKTNRVQFTTRFPPAWQELISTNGTGQRLQVVDPQSADSQRFYRVRVDF